MHKSVFRQSSSQSLLQKRYLSPSKDDQEESMSKIRQSKRIAQQQKSILAAKEEESKPQRRSMRNQKAFQMEDEHLQHSYWMDYEMDTNSRETAAFTEDIGSTNSFSFAQAPIEFVKVEKPNPFKFLLDFSDESDANEDLEMPEPVPKVSKPAPSMIQKYLEDNYMKVSLNSSVFLQGRSKIRSYAVKCDKNKAVQILEFIANQWEVFNRVWILMDDVLGEVAFLFNNSTQSASSFFTENFGLACPEFYLLKPIKSTPDDYALLSARLQGQVLFQFKIPKSEESFLDNFKAFERFCNLNGVYGICNFEQIQEELQDLEREQEGSEDE